MGDPSKDIRDAARRVRARGAAAPWTAHPDDLHMSLFVAGELSERVRTLFGAHLAECYPCQEETEHIRRALGQITSHAEALEIALGALKEAEVTAPLRELVSMPLIVGEVEELVGAGSAVGTSQTVDLKADAYALVSTEASPCPVFLSTKNAEFRVTAIPLQDRGHCAFLPAELKGSKVYIQARAPHWSLVPITQNVDRALRRERLRQSFQLCLFEQLVALDKKSKPTVDVVENHGVMDAEWWINNSFFQAIAKTYSAMRSMMPESAQRRLVLVHEPEKYSEKDLKAMEERLKKPDGDVYWAPLKEAASLKALDCAIVDKERVFSIDRVPGENTFLPQDLGTRPEPARAIELWGKIDQVIKAKGIPVASAGKLTPAAAETLKAEGVEGLIRKVNAGDLPREKPRADKDVRVEMAQAAFATAIDTVASLPKEDMATALREGFSQAAATETQIVKIKTVIGQYRAKKEASEKKKTRS